MNVNTLARLRVVANRPRQEDSAAAPLLEVALRQTNSQGAYVYQFAPEQNALALVLWRGAAPTAMDRVDVELTGATAKWYRGLAVTTFLGEGAWADWRLQDFPEFLENRFPAAAAIPLLDGGKLVGVANFGRLRAGDFSAPESAFLRSLSLPLGALLAGSAAQTRLRAELEKVSRQLAGRKNVERAKGLLQDRFACTEEAAYLHLRRAARQQRRTMDDVARELIERSSADGELERAARSL